MLFALLALLIANDPRSILYGKWEGESICTNIRPSCRDEHAVYHIAPSDKAGKVVITGSKVVDGKEVVMGTFEFSVDATGTMLTATFGGADWTLTRTANRIVGTAKQPPRGEVIRNIRLEKR